MSVHSIKRSQILSQHQVVTNLFKIVHYAHLLYIYIYIYILFFQLVIGTIVSISYFNYRFASVCPAQSQLVKSLLKFLCWPFRGKSKLHILYSIYSCAI